LFKRLLLGHWHLIVAAALASGAGAVAAVVWPPFQNRAGAIAQPGREAASHAVERAAPATTIKTPAAIPSGHAGINTVEPGYPDAARPERTTSVMAPQPGHEAAQTGEGAAPPPAIKTTTAAAPSPAGLHTVEPGQADAARPERTTSVMAPQQGREAALQAGEGAAPLTTIKTTTATAPSAVGLNAAEPGQADAMRPEHAMSVMTPDRQAQLLKRGSNFLKDGNVAAARLMLQSVADAGNAEAALLLGATYDPLMPADPGVRGLKPDREAARAWYRRAQEYGSSEASARIERLAATDK
jgi:hypothetical protein